MCVYIGIFLDILQLGRCFHESHHMTPPRVFFSGELCLVPQRGFSDSMESAPPTYHKGKVHLDIFFDW